MMRSGFTLLHQQRCSAPAAAPLRRQSAVLRLPRAAVAASAKTDQSAPGIDLLKWLQDNGAPEQLLEIRTLKPPGSSRPLDMSVAARDLAPGEVALSIPHHLTVTLDGIFESQTVAELLTTGKLSELACLALYLMYEKKVGRESFWHTFIKELDRQRARGVQAVESPLLWSDQELESLLQGSPVVAAVRERLAGIRKEYEELDTVWFMAGSLFNRYPFDVPSEAFSFELFKQAFAAVQASTVHLQGVDVVRRFCLVPLGPPLLSYSSTAKSMLSYNKDKKAVELIVDRPYKAGEPVYAWCGPQPNSRLLINYGIVDEQNPHDRLSMTVALASTDPLFQQKRTLLQALGLSASQSFSLQRGKPLPPRLVPFMCLALATDPTKLQDIQFGDGQEPVAQPVEPLVVSQLVFYLQQQLAAYAQPLWRDLEVLDDPSSSPRQKVAARLTKIEKSILQGALEQVQALGQTGGDAGAALPKPHFTVKFH